MHLAMAGLIGCGKDTAAEYISKKYGYRIIQFADVLRSMLKKEGIPVTRESLQQYRREHGQTFLAEECVRIAAKKTGKLLFIPMRTRGDYKILKRHFPDITLIWVSSSKKTRFARLSKRRRENDPTTMKAFEAQDSKEKEMFDFDFLRNESEYTIQNNGTLKDLHANIDKVMRKVI